MSEEQNQNNLQSGEPVPATAPERTSGSIASSGLHTEPDAGRMLDALRGVLDAAEAAAARRSEQA